MFSIIYPAWSPIFTALEPLGFLYMDTRTNHAHMNHGSGGPCQGLLLWLSSNRIILNKLFRQTIRQDPPCSPLLAHGSWFTVLEPPWFLYIWTQLIMPSRATHDESWLRRTMSMLKLWYCCCCLSSTDSWQNLNNKLCQKVRQHPCSPWLLMVPDSLQLWNWNHFTSPFGSNKSYQTVIYMNRMA